MLWLLAILALAVGLVVVAWQWDYLPRDVIATGTVELPDGRVLETRQYRRTSRQHTHKSPSPGHLVEEEVWEVRLPSGRWIDCGGGCAETARRAL